MDNSQEVVPVNSPPVPLGVKLAVRVDMPKDGIDNTAPTTLYYTGPPDTRNEDSDR